nr:hypothetical protein [Tanacetum cinerariifolium]
MTYPLILLEGLPFELERNLLPMTPRNLIFAMVTVMGIRHSKANALHGVPFNETIAEVINSLAIQPPSLYSSITIEVWSGREDSPPPGFLTLTPLLVPKVGELPPITAFTFTTRSPDNMPLANRASTSANPDHVTSPAFVEANYEILESLLRDRRRKVRNEDLHTELDNYSEEYDKEREMEPRPARMRETTHVLRTGSLRVRRHRGKVIEFKEAPNMDIIKVGRESDGKRPLKRKWKKEQRISSFVHGLKIRILVEFLSTDLPTTYKGLTEKTYTWIEAKEVATNGAPSNHKEGFDEVRISRRKVNRVYMDSGSSCEVIYEHCSLDLNPSIRSLRVDSKIPLVGFSREHSWPLEDIILEITVGESPYTRTENPKICHCQVQLPLQPSPRKNIYAKNRDHSVYNSCINKIPHFLWNWHRILNLRTQQSGRGTKEGPGYHLKEQTVFIKKQLPTSFQRKLQDLLRSNVDVFAWTYADMTGIPRTIMGQLTKDWLTKGFNDQTRRNLKAYVDDIVIKSASEEGMLMDI